MKHYKLGLIISLVAALSACSSTSEDTQAKTTKSDNESELICQTFAPTGSHIKKRVCKTPEQVELEKARDKESIRSLNVDKNDSRI